jgi:hypothetical protein
MRGIVTHEAVYVVHRSKKKDCPESLARIDKDLRAGVDGLGVWRRGNAGREKRGSVMPDDNIRHSRDGRVGTGHVLCVME